MSTNNKYIYKGNLDTDILFFDATIVNEDKISKNSQYFIERDSDILFDCSKFYVSILKFNISNFFIPIGIMPVAKTYYEYANYDIEYINLDPQLLQYSITIEYDNDVRLEYIIWNPELDESPPNPFINPQTNKQVKSNYYFCVTFQWFLNQLNTALSTGFNALLTKPSTIGGNPPAPPIFTYNSVTQLFSFVCQKDYYDISLANPIKIYMNHKLFTIMGSFIKKTISLNDFANDGRDILLYPSDYYYNNLNTPNYNPPFSGDYLVITQEYISILNWNPFKRIIFSSNTLPVNQTLINGNGDDSIKALDSFIAPSSTQERTQYTYTPQFPGRLLNMTTTSILRKIDINIYWVDVYGNIYILQIPWNQQSVVDLLFSNKEMYKNYYPIKHTID